MLSQSSTKPTMFILLSVLTPKPVKSGREIVKAMKKKLQMFKIK